MVCQVKNKEGLVKMTVSNGLMKNNFSYATVMTMSSEVELKLDIFIRQININFQDKEKMSPNPPRPPHNGKKQFRFVVGPEKPFKKSPKSLKTNLTTIVQARCLE